MKLFTISILLFYSTSVFASDATWKKRIFRSTEGNVAVVNYQLDRRSDITYLTPFVIDLSGSGLKSAGLKSSSRVRAIITQDCRSPHFNQRVSFALDLIWYRDHFSADFADSKLMMSGDLIPRPNTFEKLHSWAAAGGYGEHCTQELSLVVDGRWQVGINQVVLDLSSKSKE